MEPVIQIEKLRFTYTEEEILHNLSVVINRGDRCFILGPNGSGKTTLLHCMSGLLSPQQGTILIEGKDISLLTRRERARAISLVAQEPPTSFPYSVIDMVVMGRTPHLNIFDRPTPKDYDIAWETLEYLGIGRLGNRTYTRLSGGEKQMVRLARALTQGSSILLLDEPTAHLDIKNTYSILNSIRQFAEEQNLTVVATVHDPNLAIDYAKSVVMIDRGSILQSGPLEKVMTAENLSKLYQCSLRTHRVNGKLVVVHHEES